MAPPKKYKTGKAEIHANLEALLKEVGDFFGIIPSKALEEGYCFLIEHDMKRFNAPEDIKEKWCQYNDIKDHERKEEIRREKELKQKAQQLGAQKKLLDDEKDKLRIWIYEEFLPSFSLEEIKHYSVLLKSDDEYKVRYGFKGLRSQYTQKTGQLITEWSKEEELIIYNLLVDLGGA